MASTQLTIAFLVAAFTCTCFGANVRINFEKCGAKGFTCETSKEIPSKVDIYFQCITNITGQDVTLYLWSFVSPATITSLTIQDCENVQLSFTCTGENKPIQWLKIKNVQNLQILPATVTHNPPKMIFENISNFETIPRHTFIQIKKIFYKPGCFIPLNDLESIFFDNVSIGTIETEAFMNLTNMKNFSWSNVSVARTNFGAIKLDFLEGGVGLLKNFNLDFVEPMAFQVIGDAFAMIQGRIGDMAASGINGTIYDFTFTNNTVCNIQSGAISILAQNVYMMDNHFQSIDSGAFQKIGPGLLHDSNRNFGRLMFVYKFNNNLIETVEDGGIRPDIQAYKNVAAEVTYMYNTMQCSCESLTWLGADIDLGLGHSVLKDFNTMILDPQNSNMCNFTPCMCFGVRSPSKKNTAVGAVF